MNDDGYRLFVNDERTLLVRIWTTDGVEVAEVATRDDPRCTWGPPITVREEA